MKQHSPRVTLAAAAFGCALIVLLVVLRLVTAKDRVQAWWFVLTKDTESITPHPLPGFSEMPLFGGGGDGVPWEFEMPVADLLQLLADYTHRPIVIDSAARSNLTGTFLTGLLSEGTIDVILRARGYHIIERGYPHRDYVLVWP